jgi:hypothetical protein
MEGRPGGAKDDPPREVNPSAKEWTMPLELIEDAFADRRNAAFLAVASELAYLPEAEGAPKYKEELGLDMKLISVGNTQVYVGGNDKHIVVAFRGTESPLTMDGLKDWLLTNAANFLIVPEGQLGTDFAAAGVGARFHSGFVTALASVWAPLSAAVDAELKKSDRPLWLTGHSLGGALAVLAAWLFYRKGDDVHQIYTFGGPMVGNDKAAAALSKALAGKLFRYIDYVDPIPRLPTISLASNDYVHCDKEMGLGEAASGGGGFLGSLVGQAVGEVLNATLIDDLWKGIMSRLNAHLMPNYRDRIGKA